MKAGRLNFISCPPLSAPVMHERIPYPFCADMLLVGGFSPLFDGKSGKKHVAVRHLSTHFGNSQIDCERQGLYVNPRPTHYNDFFRSGTQYRRFFQTVCKFHSDRRIIRPVANNNVPSTQQRLLRQRFPCFPAYNHGFARSIAFEEGRVFGQVPRRDVVDADTTVRSADNDKDDFPRRCYPCIWANYTAKLALCRQNVFSDGLIRTNPANRFPIRQKR